MANALQLKNATSGEQRYNLVKVPINPEPMSLHGLL